MSPVAHRVVALAAVPLCRCAAVLLLAVGCDAGRGEQEAQPPPLATPSSQEPVEAADRPRPTDADLAELETDYRSAIGSVDAYWKERWSSHLAAGRYSTPAVQDYGYALPGVYAAQDGAASCDGDPLPAFDASYCAGEHEVAFSADLLVHADSRIGDAFVFLVVAHEWGHAVAELSEQAQPSVAGELLADCLAGATLHGMASMGIFGFEEGDEQEIVDGLTDISEVSPCGDPARHGDPAERVEAFDAGKEGSVAACVDGE